jgi:predicted NAD/FAD-binding protein
VRVAIIGSGVSGLVCAHALHRTHDITVFEAGDHIGGHVHTHRIDLADETHHVDTGFIVYNERNYPNFTRLLHELSVPTAPSDMSFGVRDERSGLEYRGTGLRSVFAQPRNAVRPAFWRLLADIARFHRHGQRLLAASDDGITLAGFLAQHGYSRLFVEDFLVPLGASIWSADPQEFDRFPLTSLARFLANHGLLSLGDHPQWRHVVGGSARYVERLVAPWIERIRLHAPVEKVVRRADGVEVVSSQYGVEGFDAIVFATHSDQALEILADPSADEREVLGAIRYQPNDVTLHTDARFLPRARRAWASWNYHVLEQPSRRATITYRMNSLQGLASEQQILVTLNRHDEVAPDRVLGRWAYAHPVLDQRALDAQRRRHRVQGQQRTWFCGAYWGYGFHEDGVRSALEVSRALGGRA